MTYEQLVELCDEIENANAIWKLREKVVKYTNFESLKKAGITFSVNDLSCDDAIIFSYIDEVKKK